MGKKLEEFLEVAEQCSYPGWEVPFMAERLAWYAREARAELAEEKAGEIRVQVPPGAELVVQEKGTRIRYDAPEVSMGHYAIRRLPDPKPAPKVTFWRRPGAWASQHFCGCCGVPLDADHLAEGTCSNCGAEGEPRDLPE